jgi:hypothetical protein
LFPKNNEEYGLKVRGYCQDPSTVTFNFYNQMSEDPRCLRAYPEFITSENSFTARDGECFRSDDKYYKLTVLPYDGRAFPYESEWDEYKFKQEPPKEEMSAMGAQNFKMEGDGYYIEVNTDTSKGYMQETTMKFDDYFMYGMDYMGDYGYDMPHCGPGPDNNMCQQKVNSPETCCTHIQGIGEMFMETSEP